MSSGSDWCFILLFLRIFFLFFDQAVYWSGTTEDPVLFIGLSWWTVEIVVMVSFGVLERHVVVTWKCVKTKGDFRFVTFVTCLN